MSQPAQSQPEHLGSEAAEAKPPVDGPATPPAARRRGRWARRLVIGLVVVLVVLAAAVGLAPTIASTPAVYNAILGVANDKLQGNLQVEGLALSWGGPIEIRGLKVKDAAQQEVLSIQRVTAEAGVWRLLTSEMAFGAITVDAPQVLVHQQRDGQVTLAAAFQPRQTSAPTVPTTSAPASTAPAASVVAPQGRLIVKGGTVRVVREGAGAYELTDVNGQVELKTLNDVVGQIDLALADGARLTGETTIRQLASQGQVDLRKANGVFRLKTDRRVKVGPLAALVGQANLAGEVDLDVEATLDAGQLQGRFALGIAGLQSAVRAAAHATPVSATVVGQVHWANEQLKADVNLAGEAGQAKAELTYQYSDRPLELTGEQLLSAVLSGEPLTLPEFALHAQADIDLAKLGQAVPELLQVRAGTELTGGKLELAELTIQGGVRPVARAALALKEVAARQGDKPVRLEPITFRLDALLETGRGLQVQPLEWKSSFAQVQAQGLASDLRTTFQADLGQVQRELGQVFDFGGAELAGAVRGTIELKRASEAQIDLGLQATAEKLRYASGDRLLDLPRASVAHRGQLALAKQKLTRVQIQEANVDLNGELIASATGAYDFEQQGLQLDVQVPRGDLAFVAARAQGLGVDALARYSGGVRLQAHVARTTGTQPLLTRGEFVVQNLGVDGKPVVEGEARVSWDGVQLAANGQSLQVASAQLESALAQLTAKDVQWKSGEQLWLAGQVAGTADVARCLQAAAPVAQWNQPPEFAGRLAFSTSGAAAGDQLTLTGQGGIEQLVIGTGASAIREPALQFAYDAKLDQTRKAVSISRCSMASQLLTAELSGSIGQYTGECQLDLSGRYSTSWEALTALLHQLAPATASTVIVSGTSASEFKVTGPARQAGTRPSFRGVATGARIGWTAAELYGVKMGAAQLAPALKDGQVTLPPTAIPAADGKVNLGAVLDFQPADPTLIMGGKTQLLEDVAVTKELGAQLLSRINPIFLHVANIEGRVNLGVQDVRVPLGASIQQQGAGQGRLDLRQVKMQPSGLLAEMLSLGGLPPETAYPVTIGALDFVLKDGRIRYDNFAMTFPAEFDLQFRGSVGLDETLDLVVSIPVRAALLDKLGVKGPTQEYAKMLGGTRVDLPLVGTREQPRLDLTKVDVQALLKDVLTKQQPAKEVEDLLKGLQGEKKKKP
jgi:hypothetical protein